ncbi:13349_t:CDS:2, partial [Acaulospora morrowiae]
DAIDFTNKTSRETTQAARLTKQDTTRNLNIAAIEETDDESQHIHLKVTGPTSCAKIPHHNDEIRCYDEDRMDGKAREKQEQRINKLTRVATRKTKTMNQERVVNPKEYRNVQPQ